MVATAPGRFDAIADLCEGDDVWRCLGDAAGQDWGDLGTGDPRWAELKVGLTDPDSATGLSVLASATAGFFGDTGFAANDFPGEFEGWLATLARASAAGDPDPALTMATRPGTYSAAGAVQAVAGRVERHAASRRSSPRRRCRRRSSSSGSTGTTTSPTPTERGTRWSIDGWSRAGDGDLAPTLKPGVMAALHNLWRQVTT